MKILLVYLFLFLVGSMLGWLIEVIFRRFFSAKRWVNPGFMKGPWLPIYGFGSVIMFTVCFVCISFFPQNFIFYNPLGGLFGRETISGATVMDLIPISLMWFGMNVLEFTAGIIFIKGFHVKLWDYSNIKGNYKGIVCPLFAVIWLAVAVIFYYAIDPFMYVLFTKMNKYMFGDSNGAVAHFGFIFGFGIIYGLLLWDLITSIGLFKTISKLAKISGITDRYENIKNKCETVIKEAKKNVGASIVLKNEKTIISNKISELIFINPDRKNKSSSNFDENGRPIHYDDEQKR